jgi:hypothetical protein
MTRMVQCAKHGRFHPEDERCPWCPPPEPDETDTEWLEEYIYGLQITRDMMLSVISKFYPGFLYGYEEDYDSNGTAWILTAELKHENGKPMWRTSRKVDLIKAIRDQHYLNQERHKFARHVADLESHVHWTFVK